MLSSRLHLSKRLLYKGSEMLQFGSFILRVLIFISLGLAVHVTAYAQEEEEAHESFYVSMNPHFLANLKGDRRFIQIKAHAMVADPDTEEAVKLHIHAIRHHILMELMEMQVDDLRTPEQKDAFRRRAVDIIIGILENFNEPADVEDFLISSMVLQ